MQVQFGVKHWYKRYWDGVLGAGSVGIGCWMLVQAVLGLGVGLRYKQCWDWVPGSGTNSVGIGCQTWVQCWDWVSDSGTELGWGVRHGYKQC